MAAGTAIDGHMIVFVLCAAMRMAAALAAFVTVIATPVASGQMATADRTAGPDWWPTKGTPPRAHDMRERHESHEKHEKEVV